ncbi:MAG: magnesium transporter [Candidatus Thermoplasmatota archaeon]|nr:magnesium transporter [Candidatus Thermoplasmatota archaeon]MBS3789590.1 magnesium transporter [Candidatus Thermoplasmatota archaeon]
MVDTLTYSWRKIFKESAGLLAIMGVIGITGGSVLGSIEETLLIYPILLFLVPVLNGVGGNLGAVLGARISSAIHTGKIEPELYDVELRDNMLVMMAMGFFVFFVFALGMAIANIFLNFGVSSLQIFTVIIGGGFITVFLITLITVGVSLWSYHKGLDPDNIVIPVETTTCDFIGIMTLAFMVWLVIL